MKPTSLKMLLAGGALSSGALAQTSGDLTILAMNVAGLPEILQNNEVPGDKTTNSRTIGSYFAKYNYDIINVQEVSLCTRAAIYSRQLKSYFLPLIAWAGVSA